MGIAAEVGEHLLGPGEGWFGVDDPFALAPFGELGGEGFGCGKLGEIGEEVQLTGPVGGLEFFQEEAPEQAREGAHGQEEAGPAGDLMPPVG